MTASRSRDPAAATPAIAVAVDVMLFASARMPFSRAPRMNSTTTRTGTMIQRTIIASTPRDLADDECRLGGDPRQHGQDRREPLVDLPDDAAERPQVLRLDGRERPREGREAACDVRQSRPHVRQRDDEDDDEQEDLCDGRRDQELVAHAMTS